MNSYIVRAALRDEANVDMASGIGHTEQDEMVQVTQFQYFHSLDGISWNDPNRQDKLYVGTAIRDFIERTRTEHDLQPVRKENIPRVVSSAALAMHDHNFIALPRSLASEGTPIIINNACASWHRLAETFTFGNARAYVGTLFPISTTEAQEVVVALLDKQFGKPLPTALWTAQRRVYGNTARRPYVMTGVYPQRLRTTRCDVPRNVVRKLASSLSAWREKLRSVSPEDQTMLKALKARVSFFERELSAFRHRWFTDPGTRY